MSGFAELDQMIRKVRNIPGIVERAAPLAGQRADQALKQNLQAGIDPNGNAWKSTKEGKRPLKNAASSVELKVVRSILLWTIKGHHYHHNKGTSRLPKRQILPVGDIPKSMSHAIKTALVEAFKREVRRG